MAHWITAWGYQPLDFTRFPMQPAGQTLRLCFPVNVRGGRVRFRLTNRYGTAPMRLEGVTVRCGSAHGSLTLHGTVPITLEPGQEADSDVMSLPVSPGDTVVLELRPAPDAQFTTGGSVFPQSYTSAHLLPRENTVPTSLLDIEPEHQAFFGVCRMEVETEDPVRTICFFGDSITHRSLWTGPLTKRLAAQRPGLVTTFNSGISGNRICYDASPFTPFSSWMGQAAYQRLEKDVFFDENVRIVTVLLGTNDIFHPLAGFTPPEQAADPAAMIGGLTRIAAQIHAHGAKAVGCTITPWKNCQGRFAAAPEAVRCTVNDWIRRTDCYDLVLDFDEMLADPTDSERMLPCYDSGDHVHPGPAGGAHMAACIPLDRLLALL